MKNTHNYFMSNFHVQFNYSAIIQLSSRSFVRAPTVWSTFTVSSLSEIQIATSCFGSIAAITARGNTVRVTIFSTSFSITVVFTA